MLIITCFVVLVLYWIWTKRARLPGGPGVVKHSQHDFFWGVALKEGKALQEDKVTIANYNFDEIKRNGYKAFGWGIVGPQSGIVLCDPDDIKYILNSSNFQKDVEIKEVFKQVLRKGLFNADGDRWKKCHATESPMFGKQLLKDKMSTVFGPHSLELTTALEAEVGSAVNIAPFLYDFTFDTMSRMTFNKEVKVLKGDARDKKFQEAFDVLQIKMFGRFLIPWWRINRKFQLTEDERAITRSLKVVDEYVAEIASTYSDEAGHTKKDVLENDQTLTGLFLKSEVAEGRDTSREYIEDMILNYMFAGRDTTAVALISSIELLCGEEEWQVKLHEEAIKCFNGNLETPLTLDDLEDCEVSKAVLLEVLRLKPSIPYDEKVPIVDDTLPSGVNVTAGDHISWLIVATNTNPAFWGPTADKFDPTRWMKPKSELPDEYHYPTFNGGTRPCLGRVMGMQKCQIALLTMFARLKFSPVEGFQSMLISSTTWQLDSDGLQVKIGKW